MQPLVLLFSSAVGASYTCLRLVSLLLSFDPIQSSVQRAVRAMVDKTVCPNGKSPDLAMRQILGRQKVPEDLCLLMAEVSMLSVERLAMLGETIRAVKTTLNAIVNDDTKFSSGQWQRPPSKSSPSPCSLPCSRRPALCKSM